MSKEALELIESIRNSEILPSFKSKNEYKEKVIYVKKDVNDSVILSMKDVKNFSNIGK